MIEVRIKETNDRGPVPGEGYIVGYIKEGDYFSKEMLASIGQNTVKPFKCSMPYFIIKRKESDSFLLIPRKISGMVLEIDPEDYNNLQRYVSGETRLDFMKSKFSFIDKMKKFFKFFS